MDKSILQISSAFTEQKLYINLVRKVSISGYKQIVYVPVRWEDRIDMNRDDSIANVDYHYSYILRRNPIFKLRFYRKIRIILKDLESKVDVDKVGMVHAHFLFSDGGVAYWLKKKYNIPYVVSVRATDIHSFFPKMVHLRKFGNQVMNEAERIVFINHSYTEIFKKKYLLSSFHEIPQKFVVIPNAIDDKWFQKTPPTKAIEDTVRLLYVGRIIKRKKLDVVISAIKTLNQTGDKKYLLEVVGDGPFLKTVKKLADQNTVFHGQVSDFKQLHQIYERCHIFAMPSLKETFGLVYIEALSQGLPIIYCKDEGVDGFFQNKTVGVAVLPKNAEDVVAATTYIIDNFEALSLNAVQASKKFNWNEISDRYIELYKDPLR